MTPATQTVWTVVVAAGSGRRFGADKLSVALRGNDTVLDMSISEAMRHSDGTVVVVGAGSPMLLGTPVAGLTFVAGGSSRSASARNGLAAVPEDATIILIHDAARPLADEGVYRRVIDAVRAGAVAVIPAIAVVDTIRAVDGAVVDREALRAVQTPQGFAAHALRYAHGTQAEATDDAALVEALGHRVVLVDGDVRNLKITRSADIAMARALIDEPG